MVERPYWSVRVSINGEEIVCIEPDCLSGDVEKAEIYSDAIREAAEHLRSFIGEPPDPNAPFIDYGDLDDEPAPPQSREVGS